MKNITIKKIKQVLNSCAFNPKQPLGTLKVILESGNQDYYIQRAKEFLHEAQNFVISTNLDRSQFQDKIKNAISLLALVILIEKEKGNEYIFYINNNK